MQTIDWVQKVEDDFFPLIAGELGDSEESTKKFQKKLDAYMPTVKVISWFSKNGFVLLFCKQTIDEVQKTEKELFVPYISGYLGKTEDEAKKLQKKLDEFMPKAKVFE